MCRKYVFACVQHLCECLRHTCVWACEHALVGVHIVWACMQVIVVICKHTSWPQSVCLATYSAWVFVHASLCKRVCVSANIISFFFQKYFLHIKLWSGNLKTKYTWHLEVCSALCTHADTLTHVAQYTHAKKDKLARENTPAKNLDSYIYNTLKSKEHCLHRPFMLCLCFMHLWMIHWTVTHGDDRSRTLLY